MSHRNKLMVCQTLFCLVTDFQFPNITLKIDGSKTIDLNTTAVLDKSENDVWRYSTVVWDNPDKKNFLVTWNIMQELSIRTQAQVCYDIFNKIDIVKNDIFRKHKKCDI